MQASYKVTLSTSQQESWNTSTDHTALLEEIIRQHADQLGYALQAYYSREKVSGVTIVPGSITLKGDITALKLAYVMEEYNACSAVDTVQQQGMSFTITPEDDSAILHFKGEYWPERD
jgi:hypothetical protein